MAIEFIFLHHTAVSYTKNPKQFAATEAFHKSKGWGTGGYNYEIAADGEIKQFRTEGSWTAAQYQLITLANGKKVNANHGNSVSICLDGDFNKEEPTLAQCKAALKLITEVQERHGVKDDHLLGHRDISTKTCPGTKIPKDYLSYFKHRASFNTEQPVIELPKTGQAAHDFFKQLGFFTQPKDLEKPLTAGETFVILKHLYDNRNKV